MGLLDFIKGRPFVLYKTWSWEPRAQCHHRARGRSIPGRANCLCCGSPSGNDHTTMYNTHNGCSPLCSICWDAMAPKERLPYYDHLVDIWEAQSAYFRYENKKDYVLTRQQIHTAVLAGK